MASCAPSSSMFCAAKHFFLISNDIYYQTTLQLFFVAQLQPIFRILNDILLNISSPIHCSPKYSPKFMFTNDF